ncbi:MAG: hypothetical protein FD129_1846 [bacterium]|nr:MAG: hypothetical protein FD129_1846 [bacterium]
MRYRVRVKKEYQQRDHGASHTLFGDLTVEAESPAAAEAAVRDLMAGQSGCVLQTVDPRIE